MKSSPPSSGADLLPLPCSEFTTSAASISPAAHVERVLLRLPSHARSGPLYDYFDLVRLCLEPNAVSSGTFHSFFRALAWKKRHFVNRKSS